MRATQATPPTLALLLTLAVTACYPPFAEMQGARMTGPHKVEVTGFYSATTPHNEGESAEKLYNHYGAMISAGISPSVDLRARIERVAVDGEPDDAFTAISVGPKFALKQDRVALFLPLGFATGDAIEESKTFQFHPTLLFTLPVSKSFELNPSVKALIPLSGDGGDVLVAANLGAAFGPHISRFAIRPEFGVLKNPSASGFVTHFSLGFSLGTGK